MKITLTKKVERRLSFGNVRYNSVQNLLSSFLLSKNAKLTLQKNKILSVLHVCETWSLTLSEEQGLSVSENR